MEQNVLEVSDECNDDEEIVIVECTETHTITVGNQNPNAEQFADWLNSQPGISAAVGRDAHSYYNDGRTDIDGDANEAVNLLWDEFCRR